jgi:ribosomal protein L29
MNLTVTYAMKNAMRIVVKSCDDLIAKENDELKEEVERLKRDLARLKGKSIVQPSQYNCEDMVKKLEK